MKRLMYPANRFKMFDVTLRDGLQTSTRTHSYSEKKTMLDSIMRTHNPPHVEVGSIVSPRLMPQMAWSMELYNYATTNYPETDFYLLIPNIKYLKLGSERDDKNFSFITSISDAFQIKNTRMDTHHTKAELNNMMRYLEKHKSSGLKKLYISCINECPIIGKLSNRTIIEEVLFYKHNYTFDNICLSDTCGTLSFNDLKYIIDNLITYGVDPRNLSIHLHLDKSDTDKLNQMIHYLMNNNIVMFDVSALEDSGGCSVTIEKGKTHRNLTYDDLQCFIRN